MRVLTWAPTKFSQKAIRFSPVWTIISTMRIHLQSVAIYTNGRGNNLERTSTNFQFGSTDFTQYTNKHQSYG